LKTIDSFCIQIPVSKIDLVLSYQHWKNADPNWYKNVLNIALLDDKITPDEDILLSKVRKKLQISGSFD